MEMIDWQLIVLQLRRHYGPLEKVSLALGKHKGWAAQISRGEIAEPKFMDGLRLLDFASDHLPPDVLRRARTEAA